MVREVIGDQIELPLRGVVVRVGTQLRQRGQGRFDPVQGFIVATVVSGLMVVQSGPQEGVDGSGDLR